MTSARKQHIEDNSLNFGVKLTTNCLDGQIHSDMHGTLDCDFLRSHKHFVKTEAFLCRLPCIACHHGLKEYVST